MKDRYGAYVLFGEALVDDGFLGEERCSSNTCGESDNKLPIVAA